jgi:hypothetical protein
VIIVCGATERDGKVDERSDDVKQITEVIHIDFPYMDLGLLSLTLA